MKKSFITLAITAALFSSTTLLAAPGDSVPNTFTNGNVADATEVNANFNEVTTQIGTVNTNVNSLTTTVNTLSSDVSALTTTVNSLPTPTTTAVYSYRDYRHTYTTKTFNVLSTDPGNNEFDTEVRTFDRTITNQVSFSRDRSLSGARTQYHTITLDDTGDLLLTKFEVHNTTTLAVTETRTLTPGITLRTENMEIGKTFGSASLLTSDTNGDSAVIQTTALLGVEDITVPMGSYTGCLKIMRDRNSERLGSNHKRIGWYCAGQGLVKQVEVREQWNGTLGKFLTYSTFWELSSATN